MFTLTKQQQEQLNGWLNANYGGEQELTIEQKEQLDNWLDTNYN